MRNRGLTLKFEKQYWILGHTQVVGIDEVGRGSLAGPVVAAAVIFPSSHRRIPEIFDSKQLTARKRATLDQLIREKTSLIGVGVISSEQIDELGIVPATYLAMQTAVHPLQCSEVALIDGKFMPTFVPQQFHTYQTIIKGDALCYSIAAASIIAKVYRDELMKKLAQEIPEYCWDENKGYGTMEHCDAIAKFGLTPHHRKSFCKKYLNQANGNSIRSTP